MVAATRVPAVHAVRPLTRPGLAIDYVEVDGIVLRAGVQPGRGVPLLLINGIGANMELLTPFVEALRGREVVTFDMPGTGGSAAALWPRRFGGLAALLAKGLDRLGYQEIDVAGISWGGALAQQFARQYSRRVRRLVLAATSAGWVMLPGRPAVLARMATPLRYLSPDYMRRSAPHIYGGEVRSTPRLVGEHTARIVAPTARGYLYQLIAGLGWTSVWWLHRLRMPTLILAGEDDPLVPLPNARLLSFLIPNSTLRIVPGGGHLFILHHLGVVVPWVEDFLDGDGT